MFLPQERRHKDPAVEREHLGSHLSLESLTLGAGHEGGVAFSQAGRRIVDPKVRAWLLMDRGLWCHTSDALEGVQERKSLP